MTRWRATRGTALLALVSALILGCPDSTEPATGGHTTDAAGGSTDTSGGVDGGSGAPDSTTTPDEGAIVPHLDSGSANTAEERPTASLAMLQVAPASGPTDGGTLVSILAKGVRPGVTVRFGDALATNVSVEGSQLIVCVTPAGPLGLVDVTLQNADGLSATLPDAFGYVAKAPLDLSGVLPASGPIEGGNTVLVKGAGFVDGMQVLFGSVVAPKATVESPSVMLAVVPPGAAGLVPVIARDPSGAEAVLAEGYTYVAPPQETVLALSSITPSTGAASGGTPFVLTGAGFSTGCGVRFGDAPATDVVVYGANVITGRTPSHAPDMASVTVTTPNGLEATLPDAFEFTQNAAPLAVSGITPNGGPESGGNLVGVHGQGFNPGAVVRFGANMAYGIQVITDTYITCTAPAGSVGAVALSVTNPGGMNATLDSAYNYTATTQLSGLSIQPQSGPASGGTLVVVSGTGFDTNTAVSLGGASPAIVELASDTALFFEAPAHAPGPVDLVLTGGDGQSVTLKNAYTFEAPAIETVAGPSITLVSPNTGPENGGTWVTIDGAGFADGAVVRFGDTPATVNVLSAISILATAPPGQGSVSVTVTNPDGQSDTLQGAFGYNPDAGAPTLLSLSPASGPTTGGTLVNLVGADFMPGAKVWFGTSPATTATWLDGQHLVAKSPSKLAGTADITVVNPDGGVSTLAGGFSYFVPTAGQLPTLFSAYPSAGTTEGGALVTLAGAGLVPGMTVHFGNIPVEVVGVQGSTSLTILTPKAPAGAVDITITTPQGLSASLPSGFLYFTPPPVIVAVSPPQGPVGGQNLVTITGKFFSPKASLRVDGKETSTVQWVSSTELTALMPPHLPGTVDLTVQNPTGLADTATMAYTYAVPAPPEPPALAALSPTAGPPGGGGQVVLTGQGFATGMTVLFGDTPAEQVVVHAATVAVATVPAGDAGAVVDMTVTNPDGLSDSLLAAYSYDQKDALAPLSVATLFPATGATDGGTVLTIAGTGFAPGTAVHFGTTAASFVTVVSSTLLTVVTPPLDAGLTDLVVKRPDGQQVVVFDAFLVTAQDTAQPMSLLSASPSVGPLDGGTLIELTGQGFSDTMSVGFGGVMASELTVLSATSALVRTPPAQAAGSVSIAATDTKGGGAVLAGGFTYYQAAQDAAPVLLSVSPQQGTSLGGTTLVVVGTGFSPGATVFVCDAKALVTAVQANTLTITTPGGGIGPCTVEVTSPGGLSGQLPNAFKYVAPTPEIGEMVPSTGTTAGGVNVVIKGQGFVPGIQVSFGGKPATAVTVWDAVSLLAVAPAADAGAVDVAVTNPGGATATATQAFTYVSDTNPPAPPVVEWLFPVQGGSEGGTPIELHGAGFESGATVLLGGEVVAQVSVVNPSLITLITPSHAEGAVTLTILNPSGLGATLANAFEFLPAGLKPPQLLGLAPNQGPASGGVPLTISGKGFAEGGKIHIGGVELINSTFVDATLITGILPAGAPGKADLTYVRPDGEFAMLKGAFDYVAPPTIDAISPAVGPTTGGNEISIVGANFQDGITTLFDGQPAQLIELVSSSQLRVSAPPANAPGLVDVRIINPDGQEAILSQGFAYLETPIIDSLEPAQGSVDGGTLVMVTGQNLHPGAQFMFGDIPAAEFASGSDTTRVVIAPANTEGISQVTVLNPDGQSAQSAFKYLAADKLGAIPTITTIAPGQGPEAGGTPVSIDGAQFTAESRVLFGGVEAVIQAVQGDSRLFVIAPPGVGSVAVSVTQPTGAFSLIENGFTYLPNDPAAPDLTVAGISPSSGPTAGGTAVTLSGAGFTLNSRVFFDLMESPDVTFVSDTELVAKTVAHTPGAADVLVVTPLGQSFILAAGFTFVAPPKVLAVTPSAVPATGGQIASVTGSGFVPGDPGSRVFLCQDFVAQTGCVTLNAADISGASDGTALSFQLPAHAPGLLDLAVVNPDGQAGVMTASVTYNPLPSVVGVSPSTISTTGGQLITVQGSGFQQGATVLVGDQPCTGVLLLSAESLKCEAPAAAAGLASVTVTNPDTGAGVLTDALTRVAPPQIAAALPNSGPEIGGNPITIQGMNFVTGAPQSQVKIGDVVVSVENTMVISDTIITVVAPAGTGQVDITVTNPDGQSDTLTAGYTFVPPIPGPTFNYAIPTKGPSSGGTLVQLVGANFLDGAQVSFGTEQTGWALATDVVVKNAGTLIRLVSPAVPAGQVDIRIVNSDGQQLIKAQAFEYLAGPAEVPLAVGSISPNRTVLSGKNVVTITGQGFAAGVMVLFGGPTNWAQAIKTERIGPTLLKVTTPPAPNGLAEVVDVRVVNPPTGAGTEEVIQPDAFVYADGSNFQQSVGSRLPSETHNDKKAWIADVNGDGFNDILVTRTSGKARVLLNVPPTPDQVGWFEEQPIDSQIDGDVEDLEFGDLDGDGDLDLVWVGSYYVVPCINDGAGNFVCKSIESNGWWSNCANSSVTLADLNCDSLLDIFVTHNTTKSGCNNRLWIGAGDGSFKRRDGHHPQHYENTRDATAVDVDLDGDIDLLLANESAMQNRLYLNNCNNTPMPPQCSRPIDGCDDISYNGHHYQYCPKSWSYQDAQAECVWSGYNLATLNDAAEFQALKPNFKSHVWLGMRDHNGDSDFQWQYDSSSYTNWQAGYPGTDTNQQCVLMNYSWDYRWEDEACTSGYHFLCEAPSAEACPNEWAFTDAQYGVGKSFPISGGNTRRMVVADINLDGWPDVVVANHDQQTSLFMNSGGQFLGDDGLRWPQDEANVHFTDLRAVDIDLDGDMDFVAVKDDKTLAIYRNDAAQGGAGVLTDATAELLPSDADGVATAIAIGDLDSDLLPDVYLVAPWYSDALLMNAGFAAGKPWLDANRVATGHFVRNTHRDVPEGFYNVRASDIGDIDNDGDADIVKCGWGEPPQILINDNGTLRDETAAHFPSGVVFECANHGVQLADLNGDGFLDIVFAEYWDNNCGDGHCSGRLSVYLNDGLSVFHDVSDNGNLPTTNWRPETMSTLDLDGDGDLDIFLGQYNGGRFFVNIGDAFHNDGVAFVEVTQQWFDTAPSIGRDAQFVDIDGNPPLDFYMSTNGQNKLYVSAGGKYKDVTTDYLPALSDNTYRVAIDDFDGDSDLDIFTSNWGWDRFHIRESAAKFSDMTTSSLANAPEFSLNTRYAISADLDLDGLPEVIEGNWEQQNHLVQNLGGGKFEILDGALPNDWDRTRVLHLADFDGDGDLDIYLVNEGQDRLYTNNIY